MCIRHLLRQFAPEWEPYRKLDGKQLRAMLNDRGVRTINPKNVPQLDPADLRSTLESSGLLFS